MPTRIAVCCVVCGLFIGMSPATSLADHGSSPSPRPPVPSGPSGAAPNNGSRADENGTIQERGFWVVGSLGVNFSSFALSDSPGLTMWTLPPAITNLVLGYKIRRLSVGAVLGFMYTRQTHSETPKADHDFILSVGPVFEYMFSQIHQVGFHATGSVQFLYGHMEYPDPDSDKDAYGVRSMLGLGTRYYFGGRVGLGLDFGLIVTYAVTSPANLPEGAEKPDTLYLAPYAALSVATIW